MFLLYFLDTSINMVKHLQRVPLDILINWQYLHQDAEKTWIIWIGHYATRYHTRYHTHYRTFCSSLTWIGQNGMRYHNHNLNMLPTLNCTFSLSLAWFGGYLQRVTTRYRHFFFKYSYTFFSINLMVTRGNLLQIAPPPPYLTSWPQTMLNWEKIYGNVCGNALTKHQNIILTFLSKCHLAWQCKYESLPLHLEQKDVQTTTLYALRINR